MAFDNTYAEKCFPGNALSTTGGIVFSEPIIATYIDLDRLIESSKLSPRQMRVIKLLMRGYNIQDIADEYQQTKQNISKCFEVAVNKIVETNMIQRIEYLKKRLSNTQ